MARSNVYSYGSEPPMEMYDDDSTNSRDSDHWYTSDYSAGSRASRPLRKLASLELGASVAGSIDGNPIIDLTHFSNADELIDNGLKFVVSVHDDESECTAGRYSSKCSQSSAPSSYVPNSYKVYGGYDHVTKPPRLSQGKLTEAKFYPSEPREEMDQPQPQMVQTLAKVPRTQQRSVFGSVFQCVNPAVPGDDMEIPDTLAKSLAVRAAIRSEEDALDRVFNTVERFSCRDDDNTIREVRAELSSNDHRDQTYAFQRSMRQPQSLFRSVPKDFSTLPTGEGKWNEKKPATAQNEAKDALDVVFEGFERFACAGAGPVPKDKDAVDRMFERVEMLTNHDDMAAADLRSRGIRAMRDASTYQSNTRSMIKGGDLFDQFGNNFERAMCTGQMAEFGHEGDVLDNVFDTLERATCRNSRYHDRYGTSEYEFDQQNSLVESVAGSSDWFDSPKSEIKRKPSTGNVQPTKNERTMTPPYSARQDMLDYVFENVEAGICRSTDVKRLSEREKARNSLERIRALRQRLESERGSCW